MTKKTSFLTQLYSLLIIVILPSIINIVFNSIIFFSVRSSTRRVHGLATMTTAATSSMHQQHTRDMYLLKHIVFMFIVFVSGWAPVYITGVVNPSMNQSAWYALLLRLLPVFSSLINIADLFFYNRELRQYLKEQLVKCLHLNRN